MAAIAGMTGRWLLPFQRVSRLIERRQGLLRRLHTSLKLRDAIQLRMPALSPTMQEGTIVKWYKKEGETINAGDVLCDIQTDKAVVSLDVDEDGVLAKIIKGDDSKDVKIGTLIAMLVEEGDDWKNVEVPQDSEPVSSGQSHSSEQASTSSTHTEERKLQFGYGPAVRTLLELYGIKLENITATGPNNRVLKGDVIKYIQSNSLKPIMVEVPLPQEKTALPAKAPDITKTSQPELKAQKAIDTDGSIDLPLTSMRKTIAKRLTESKQNIPHAYASIECNMKEVTATRKKLAAEDIKVSVNDFIIKAAAISLQAVPGINAQWNDGATKVLNNIDISIAVATDSGLITPIVKDALGKGVKEISENVKELAGRARIGKLKLDEFQGGSFTISNLGMFGVREFTAVINPPQACILAIGAARIVPNDEGGAQTMVTVTMSSDARVVDDALAAEFLKVFKETLENPLLMLSHSVSHSIQDLDEDEALKRLFAK